MILELIDFPEFKDITVEHFIKYILRNRLFNSLNFDHSNRSIYLNDDVFSDKFFNILYSPHGCNGKSLLYEKIKDRVVTKCRIINRTFNDIHYVIFLKEGNDTYLSQN